MQAGIIDQGLELMLYGMGTVVVFLALLVVATTFMSRLVERFFAEPEVEAPPARPVANAASAVPSGDAQLLAVISAAIHQHRKQR
ncbi:OadG family protein [Parahaliea mediterranea]|uniref:OadG family protein n=1 Tax=Parahaliea mediterranea TaxID=651086 RepID=UPI000E2E8A07|nr:OadG family transporter subunit [Parahaliea mediterranea]